MDLKTGKRMRIDVDFSGDVIPVGFTEDGRVLAEAAEYRFSIWRFRQDRPTRPGAWSLWQSVWQRLIR